MAQVPVVDNNYVGNGVNRVFSLDWPYLSPSEVFVSVDGVNVTYAWLSGSAGTVQTTVAPPNGSAVRVYRNTRAVTPLHSFDSGVPFLPRYVDENNKQLLYATQEAVNDTAVKAAEALRIADNALDVAQAAEDKIDGAIIDSAYALRQQLANGGTALVDAAVVGYVDPVPNTLATTIADIIRTMPVSGMRYIPKSLHAAILAGTSTENVHTYLNTALLSGAVLELPQGRFNLGAPLTTVQGAGIVGQGEKTQFIRRFTGGPMIRHPGGNQLGSPIVLRDFYIGTSGVTVVNGDTGIDIGYAAEWGGRGDIANLLIMGQWDGFKWVGGTMNQIHSVQCLENKGNGFLGINARGELVSCLAQYNAGHGYSMYASKQNETGVQFTSCGTFGNQGWGYLFDAAPGVIGANIYMKGVSSSTDGTGGIGFVKEYRQIWMTQILIESAGDAYVPYPAFVKHADAPGLYMVGGCKQIVGSDIYIQTCLGNGVFLDATQRASFVNLTSLDNGRGGLGGANAVGINVNSNNIDLVLTNAISDFGGSQSADIAFGNGNEVALIAPKFRTSSGGGSGVRGLLTKTTATRTLSAANPLNLPWYGDLFLVSGTTAFNFIAASYEGRRITLRFDSNLTVYNDGNIKLPANAPVNPGATLSLICDGTNWYKL